MAGAATADEKVIAAGMQIVKSLATSTNSPDEILRILSDFDHRISASRLDAAAKDILRWQGSNSSVWESSPTDAARFLSAVDDVIRFAGSDEDGLRCRAKSLLQIAMDRLEDEFLWLINRNSAPFDVRCMQDSFQRLFHSFSSDSVDAMSVDSDSSVKGEHLAANPEERGASSPDQSSNLIPPDLVSDLKNIADRMMSAGYGKELCLAYGGARHEILMERLSALGIDIVNVDEVQRIDKKALEEMMKTWIQSLKIVVKDLLWRERKLCDQIFATSDELKEECFTEATKVCVMRLLNFGDVIATGKLPPLDKVFGILAMYEALADVFPDLMALFSGNLKEFIRWEVEENLGWLEVAARGTFAQFGTAIQRLNSQKPLQGEEIHSMIRYVMKYVRLLMDHSATLNVLLADGGVVGGGGSVGIETKTPLGDLVYFLISEAESKLEEKSKLFEDDGMQYIFLMNNIFYMVLNVKDSELNVLLGDAWVLKCRRRIQQLATCYLRASWTKVLSCLKDEGLSGSGGSHNVSRAALKERFKNFNLAFEEIYRTQTTWKVADSQLRQELRISISEMIIPAYRSFVGRFHGQLEGERHAAKYIKYTTEDIENYLSDLFEGLPVQSSLRRKKT